MSIYSTHKPAAGEGSGLYLKIKDGESVKLRIASEPAIFETEGERDGKTTLSTRYGWIVFNQNAKAAQIFQQSATFFKNIAALAQDEEWGDPQGYDIKVSRQGSGLETTYNVMPSANREPLAGEAKDAVKALDLLEKLKASPFSQRVMWLSDFDNMATKSEGDYSQEVETLKAVGEARKSGHEKARETADKIKAAQDEPVITDIGDGEVDLSDIPF